MFRDEYELTSHLDDNRLVKMTDYFVAEESPCLVMPFMQGGSLYQKLQKENELPEREIARILYHVCGALNYLHSQENPVLHLDIKPENILIDYSGNYLLADFGISLKMRSSLIRASNTKGGTFAYSPPELSESRKLNSGSDIFSLGVMLFELCTGALPWSGMGGNAVVIGMPLPDLSETYSHRLQEIMHSCMERYPHNRPTARQLEEVARKFLDRSYWDTIQKNVSNDELSHVPSSSENLQKAIIAGEIGEFVKRHNGQPTAQQREQLFYDINKRYGNISRDRFDVALQEVIEIKGRETQLNPQSKPQSTLKLQTQSSKPDNRETSHEKKRNHSLWIISSAVIVICIVTIVVWLKVISAEQLAEQDRQISRTRAHMIAMFKINNLKIQHNIAANRSRNIKYYANNGHKMEVNAPLQSEKVASGIKEDESAAIGDIFKSVEVQPSFPGGEEARISYLQQNIKYPEEAQELGIQGKIFMTFVVEVDGTITDVRVLRGIGGSCDEEAIRIIKTMPKWNPGKMEGKPVRTQFNMSLKFTLK
jgi:TonB family protein